ncbi:MAG: winged helix-turn-helix transcriptional regulator [Candidatus Altiarchaeota archaeon]|nr:winged helix-turn-helix transcriptional regulator [Candidatus Altiarchaeota archaeon]
MKSKDVNPDEAYDYFLGTLANRTRLKIIKELLKGEKNVGQLTVAIGVDQSTISNNLKRLRDCGFVNAKPNGKQRIYILNRETIEPLIKLIDTHVNKYCINCVRGSSFGE